MVFGYIYYCLSIDMFEYIEYVGIVAFAISGFLIAVKNSLDLLGILVSTFLTALGGGLIRDTILQTTPYSFGHTTPAILILAVIFLLTVFKLYKKDLESNFFFILSDSLGLVAFSISGTSLAIEAGLNLTGVLSIAFISGVGGGVVRDIIINEVPQIFKSGFYGTITLIVALLLYSIWVFGILNYYSLISILVIGVTLRVIAYYKDWHIPKLG